jgi:Na+/H+ antiporter NhaC
LNKRPDGQLAAEKLKAILKVIILNGGTPFSPIVPKSDKVVYFFGGHDQVLKHTALLSPYSRFVDRL